MSKGERLIKIPVAHHIVTKKVAIGDEDTEHRYRKAAEKLNKMLAEYNGKFPTASQEICLALCAFELALKDFDNEKDLLQLKDILD